MSINRRRRDPLRTGFAKRTWPLRCEGLALPSREPRGGCAQWRSLADSVVRKPWAEIPCSVGWTDVRGVGGSTATHGCRRLGATWQISAAPSLIRGGAGLVCPRPAFVGWNETDPKNIPVVAITVDQARSDRRTDAVDFRSGLGRDSQDEKARPAQTKPRRPRASRQMRR